jgi:hypothetical protein
VSLPVLAKSWLFNLNHRVAAAGTAAATCQAVLRYTKNTLLGFASNAWTVIGSCNSVASGMDAVDRWITDGNLVWSASPGTVHSWIVLQQAAINPKFQLCIALNPTVSSSTGRANILISPTAGFGLANGGTNGSTTVRPTATDEITLVAVNAAWLDGNVSGTNADYLVNVWQSSDGQVTRILFRSPQTASDQFRGYASFERPKNPIAAWTSPCVAGWLSSLTGALKYSTLNDAANLVGNKPSGGSMSLFCTTEGVNAGLGENVTTVNDLTGGYQITPMGLLCTDAGARGRHGELFDLWFGVTALQDGDTYPSAGTKQLIQTGHLVQVWNGSTPIMS